MNSHEVFMRQNRMRSPVYRFLLWYFQNILDANTEAEKDFLVNEYRQKIGIPSVMTNKKTWEHIRNRFNQEFDFLLAHIIDDEPTTPII